MKVTLAMNHITSTTKTPSLTVIGNDNDDEGGEPAAVCGVTDKGWVYR